MRVGARQQCAAAQSSGAARLAAVACFHVVHARTVSLEPFAFASQQHSGGILGCTYMAPARTHLRTIQPRRTFPSSMLGALWGGVCGSCCLALQTCPQHVAPLEPGLQAQQHNQVTMMSPFYRSAVATISHPSIT